MKVVGFKHYFVSIVQVNLRQIPEYIVLTLQIELIAPMNFRSFRRSQLSVVLLSQKVGNFVRHKNTGAIN